MAYNPFLSGGEQTAPTNSEVLNPFMMSEAEPTIFSGDNPFATSNPFSDFGGYEPPAGDTVPLDIFGSEPAGARHFDGFVEVSNEGAAIAKEEAAGGDRFVKPTDLGLVTTSVDGDGPQLHPLPPETQNLILSVTGHMEFASSHLLDRIPPTRTPSPVSARDIHSPSPTPEPEAADEPPLDSFDINRNKPARPPPARPPQVARPPPPRPAPPPPPQQLQSQPDDINLFDAPVPSTVKPTKEDILSLYSAPKKEERQIDFLSDDILEETPLPEVTGLESRSAATVTSASTFVVDCEVSRDAVAPMDCSEPPADSPIVPTDTSPSVSGPDDDKNPFQAISADDETSPFADAGDSSSPFAGAGDTTSPFVHSVMNSSTAGAGDTTSTFVGVGDTRLPFAGEENSPFIGDATSPFVAEPSSQFVAEVSSPFVADESSQMITDTTSQFIADTTSPFTVETTSPFTVETTSPFVGDTALPFVGDTTSPFVGDTASPFVGETTSPFVGDTASPFVDAVGDTFGASPEDAFMASGMETTEAGAGDATREPVSAPEAMVQDAFSGAEDDFDAFYAKFDSTSGANHIDPGGGTWGEAGEAGGDASGFEAEAFDPFLAMGAPPPPAATPRLHSQDSRDSADDTFSLFIRPKESDGGAEAGAVPALAPPPRPATLPAAPPSPPSPGSPPPASRAPPPADGGDETPPTPLFDEDVSMPLEDFPRTQYRGPGWEMHLRQPNKKKITGQRFWKKIFVRLTYQGDNPAVQLYNAAGDKEPFQELPLQACYSVSDVGAQQFDQFGKIFTVKLQYVFYKERPGVRPGQVTKAERITNKLSQFAAYAIQGDYQGVKEFGSDLRKLGLPVEHAPQVSQLFKLGSLAYEDVKQFSCCVEEALFRLPAHRDRALAYKMEEVQITAVDELYVEQDAEGSVLKQIARVRLFFLGFLSGMPDVELGVNDLRRQGKEVVGRHDIIPVVTEEWIRVEDTEFHACVQPDEFAKSQIIKFKPPDACYIELMRFRVRPPKNRELPLQLKAVWCVTGNKVELRADVLVPGFASRKLGQVPCEDVAIRFPIPECWIYLFRVEKHFRYGSVKSAHRRTGKIKGIERLLGAVDTLQESLIEVTSGQAKYEHQHRAIVWRMPRLPKEGQGAYTTHNLVCRMALTSYDQVPQQLAREAHVEFTMPATQVSHVTVRSVSLQGHDGDPPEKCVRYLARHEYTVGIERTSGQAAPAYAAAATVEQPAAAPAPPAPLPPQPPSSDSDSD